MVIGLAAVDSALEQSLQPDTIQKNPLNPTNEYRFSVPFQTLNRSVPSR